MTKSKESASVRRVSLGELVKRSNVVYSQAVNIQCSVVPIVAAPDVERVISSPGFVSAGECFLDQNVKRCTVQDLGTMAFSKNVLGMASVIWLKGNVRVIPLIQREVTPWHGLVVGAINFTALQTAMMQSNKASVTLKLESANA